MPVDFNDYNEDDDNDFESRSEFDSDLDEHGKGISKEDLQDLAKVGSGLLRRTVLSGFDIFKEASKDIPKEATHFISARKEQVLKSVSNDMMQTMVTSAIENFFEKVREHRLEVSFRIVKDDENQSRKTDDTPEQKSRSGSASKPRARSAKRRSTVDEDFSEENENGQATEGQSSRKSAGPSSKRRSAQKPRPSRKSSEDDEI